MLTPDGRECPYYYANYHRRTVAHETCNLLEGHPDLQHWTPARCATCPTPDIRRANACETMQLHARIGRRRWRFWEKERVLITATCDRGPVKDPRVGCGNCHEPLVFVVAEEDTL